MAANNSISLSELDVDRLKQSFIDYLKTQPVFKDYDYTGSNINTLLDLFARNTYMNSFMLNMVANESFLDSAQLRDSAVSRAKELNYVPRSYRSATAYLNITITGNSTPGVVTIPEGTTFTTRMDDQVYNFSTDQNVSITPTSYDSTANLYYYSFTDIPIYEGRSITETFLVDNTIENQVFTLSNEQLDTTSLKVRVIESATNSSNTEYTRASTLLNLNSNSSVYFVQGASRNRYEIVFGDDVLGKKPVSGNIVSVSYRIASGDGPNGASTFALSGSSIGGYSTYSIGVSENAAGGSVQETLESIKYNAPRHYQTQERAIAPPDYESMLLNQFPDIRAINVYGGEEVSPPKYGKVIIAVDMRNFDGVPSATKTTIESYLKPKMSLHLEPQVVNPTFLYLEITADLEYSLDVTNLSPNDIKTLAATAIANYSESYLEDFGVKFRFALLGSAINDSNDSITGSNVTVRMFKNIAPTLNTSLQTTLYYQNALVKESVKSSAFTYNDIQAYLQDDGSGNLNIVTTSGDSIVKLTSPIGTVDYDNGIVNITSLTVSDYVGDAIKVYAESQFQDIVAEQNTILKISAADTTITAVPIRS